MDIKMLRVTPKRLVACVAAISVFLLAVSTVEVSFVRPSEKLECAPQVECLPPIECLPPPACPTIECPAPPEPGPCPVAIEAKCPPNICPRCAQCAQCPKCPAPAAPYSGDDEFGIKKLKEELEKKEREEEELQIHKGDQYNPMLP